LFQSPHRAPSSSGGAKKRVPCAVEALRAQAAGGLSKFIYRLAKPDYISY
jgi:hypothetical protein